MGHPHHRAGGVAGGAPDFILPCVLCWDEYFFAALLTSSDAETLPRHGRQPSELDVPWWSLAALSTVPIAPLVVFEQFIIKGLTAGAGR